MKDPIKIQPLQPDALGKSFEELRQEGIALLQNMAGDHWTDYNEHDPGVTILEALCYALTELNYKTSLPMADILASGAGKPLDPPHDALYTVPNILPCRPLTLMDYRKVLIDGLQGVRNAWVQPFDHSIDHYCQTPMGLYKVFLQMERYPVSGHVVEMVKKRAGELIMAYRNVCEDFVDIQVQEPVMIQLSTEIVVEPDQDVEDIAARVLFYVQQYLSPHIKFHTLKDMMDTGQPIEDIFDGPLLVHGFIEDEDLNEPIRELRKSDLLKVLSSIPGVRSVQGFTLLADGEEVPVSIAIPEVKTAVLDVSEAGISQINFLSGPTIIQADAREAISKFELMVSARQRSYRVDESMDEFTMRPTGRVLPLKHFRSIQRDFPKNYGLGPDRGVSEKDKERQAQIKQLKAYVMLFEQVIADYLAHLEGIEKLYSIEHKIDRTYNFQPLTDVPGFEDIIQPFGDLAAMQDEDASQAQRMENYMGDLRELNRKFDPFLDRRNRFLDALLARFNEQFDTHLLSKFNAYYDKEQLAAKLILWKRQFLTNYRDISRGIGGGVNYRDASWNVASSTNKSTAGNDNVAGVVKLISHRLGIDNYHDRSLSDVLVKEGFQTSRLRVDEREYLSESLRSADGTSDFEYTVSRDHAVLNAISRARDSGEFAFILPGSVAVKDLLRFGIDDSAYVTLPQDDQGNYVVCFKPPNSRHAFPVFQTRKPVEAEIGIQKVTDYLKKISRDSEGMHLLEHALLRPDAFRKRFGFTINVPGSNSEPLLVSPEPWTLEKRMHIIEQLFGGFERDDLLSIREEPSCRFRIQLKSDEGEVLAVSPKSYDTHHHAETRLKGIELQVRRLLHQEPEAGVLRLLSYYHNSDGNICCLDEAFLCFGMTLFLPDWPARFQNADFQSLFAQVAIENVPMHVTIYWYWLSVSDMREFESRYSEWLEAMTKSHEKAERPAYELIQWMLDHTTIGNYHSFSNDPVRP